MFEFMSRLQNASLYALTFGSSHMSCPVKRSVNSRTLLSSMAATAGCAPRLSIRQLQQRPDQSADGKADDEQNGVIALWHVLHDGVEPEPERGKTPEDDREYHRSEREKSVRWLWETAAGPSCLGILATQEPEERDASSNYNDKKHGSSVILSHTMQHDAICLLHWNVRWDRNEWFKRQEVYGAGL